VVLLLPALVAASVAACFTPADGVCRNGETRACYAGPRGTEGVGACAPGTQTCSDNAWEANCLGDVTPFVEHCNGIDDDCNGIVDDVEEYGQACVGTNDCPGVRQCIGEEVGCVAQKENACGLCAGPDIAGLGDACTLNGCDGAKVCTADGTGTECGAPAQNECGVCGGPAVTDLGTVCMASAGCAGQKACNQSGNSSTCDCSVNICNDNGTIRSVVSPGAGDLVITEVMPSPSKVSDTVGEWFEVKATAPVDLNNLLLDRASDSANPNVVNVYDCIHLNAGDYAVFARDVDPLVNGGINGVVARFTFSVLTGSTAAPGDIRVLAPDGTTVVDSVTWTSSRAGTALQLDPDFTTAAGNDTEANFCDASAPYGLGDLGTPGTANAQCPVVLQPGECLDNGTPRAIMKPATATDLVITEVMANPTASTETLQEWIEITNVGTTPFDLNGLAVDRGTDTAAPATLVTDTNCHIVAPSALALLARNGTSSTNGGLPTPDATYGSIQLVNSSGEVQIVDPSTCATTTPFACTTIYDAMPYGSPADGVSVQVKPGFFTTTLNDSSANRCPAVTPYGDGTNNGTPRLANSCT
jgi:hypothetical protein